MIRFVKTAFSTVSQYNTDNAIPDVRNGYLKNDIGLIFKVRV